MSETRILSDSWGWKTKVQSYYQPEYDAYGLWISLVSPEGQHFDVTGLEITPHCPGAALQKVISIGAEAAQRLADGLYSGGIRPTDARGSAGAMAATQAHIKDLQKANEQLLPAIIEAAKSATEFNPLVISNQVIPETATCDGEEQERE